MAFNPYLPQEDQPYGPTPPPSSPSSPAPAAPHPLKTALGLPGVPSPGVGTSGVTNIRSIVQQGVANQPTPVFAPPAYDPNSDPYLKSATNEANLGLAQADAALKKAREQAIIRFGDPALASLAGFGLDPQAAAFAQQNYISGNAALARLDKAHQLRQKAVIDRLAAHGILGSGDLGYLSGEEGSLYGNQVYDARNQLLDYLSNLYNNYLTSKAQIRQAQQQAASAAYQNWVLAHLGGQ